MDIKSFLSVDIKYINDNILYIMVDFILINSDTISFIVII